MWLKSNQTSFVIQDNDSYENSVMIRIYNENLKNRPARMDDAA